MKNNEHSRRSEHRTKQTHKYVSGKLNYFGHVESLSDLARTVMEGVVPKIRGRARTAQRWRL